jgi:hypothetical protein
MQLVILGMHRSGTSLLARILNLMGAYFGEDEDEIAGSNHNPKGYWERRDTLSLNEDVLKSVDRTWCNVTGFKTENIPVDFSITFEKRIEKIIRKLDKHRPWVLKEPRLCLTFNLWKNKLESPLIIKMYRNPLEVAMSLNKRNSFPLGFGMALWEKYNLDVINSTRGMPFVAISYSELLTTPFDTVTALHNELVDKGVRGLRVPSEVELKNFIDDSLYRNRATEELSLRQKEVIEGLKLERSDIQTELSMVSQIELFTEENRQKVELESSEKHEKLERKLLTDNNQIHETEQKLLKTEGLLKDLEIKLNESESKLNESESKLNESESKLNESESKLNESESKLNESESKLNESQNNIEELSTHNEKQNIQFDMELKQLKNYSDGRVNDIRCLIGELEKLKTQLAEARRSSAIETSKIHDLKVAFNLKETDCNSLMLKVDQLNSLVSISNSKLDELSTQNEKQNIQFDTELEQLKNYGDDRVNDIRCLISELETLKTQLAEAIQSSAIKTSKIHDLKVVLNLKETDCNNLMVKIDRLNLLVSISHSKFISAGRLLKFIRKINPSSTYNKEYRIIKNSGLFDAEWYRKQRLDLPSDWKYKKLLTHYLIFGGHEGFSPNSKLDLSLYSNTHKNKLVRGTNPLVLYIKENDRRGVKS